MTIWMMTMPRSAANKRTLKLLIEEKDIHKWVIGYETGRSGYKHFQVRLSWDGTFDQIKEWFPDANIREGQDEWYYETKSGRFVSSDDTVDVRRCRFGTLRSNQQKIYDKLQLQSDRGITVWLDRTGNIGKSFFTRWLVERRMAYYVPPTIDNARAIIQYVCAGYQNQPIIVVDIPRTAKWNDGLYTAIEAIKDGIVYDTRYTAKMRDIWGVKILVLTNTEPKLGKLSRDRWDIIDEDTAASENEHQTPGVTVE